MGNKSTSGKVSTSDKYLAKYLICIQTIPAHPNFRFRTEFDLRLDWYQTLGLCSQQTGLAEPGYEVGPLNYIYTWKANCQSKSEAKNGGHGAFLDVSFRPLCGHHRCQSQMVSRILIGRWPRRGLKLTSRRPPCRPCLASRFRPMINGSWPSRYIYIQFNGLA